MKFKFDRIAKYYDLLEILAFGKILSATRLYLLTKTCNLNDILLIGEGTGCFLKNLVRCYPKSSITILDSSNRMIDIMRGYIQISKIQNITILQEDYFNHIPRTKYDLIYTNFFLDCYKQNDVLKLVDKIKSMLNKSGEWNDVDFTTPHGRNSMNYNYNKFILKVLYKFFRLICKIESASIKNVDFDYQKFGFILDREVVYQFPSVRVRKYKLV